MVLLDAVQDLILLSERLLQRRESILQVIVRLMSLLQLHVELLLRDT